MGIGGGKEAVTDPHRQVRQCELAHGHDVIFAVIQFMHHALFGCQVFQCAQEFALFATIAFMLATLLMAFLLDTIDALPQRFQLCVRFGFELLTLSSARVPSVTPCASNACSRSFRTRYTSSPRPLACFHNFVASTLARWAFSRAASRKRWTLAHRFSNASRFLFTSELITGVFAKP